MPVAAHPVRRRTQGERSAETRLRILDAALECLADQGYAGTTTTAVALRAGVSRGAQLHHFPTRAALVGAAVQHLFARLTEDYEKTFASLSSGAQRAAAALDLLWDTFQDARLAAVLELYVAGRTDPELRARLAPIAAAHRENVAHLARAYFPEAAESEAFDALLRLVLDALQGMAVAQLVAPDPREAADALAHLKRLAATELAALRAGRRAGP